MTIWIHPGYVTSIYDGQDHYINASQLAKLYNLKPGSYRVYDRSRSENIMGIRFNKDDIHLYPRSDGNYNFS